jgi:hypothetical protein
MDARYADERDGIELPPSGAERLRAKVAAAMAPAGHGPEFEAEWERFEVADDWLADHRTDLAVLAADMADEMRPYGLTNIRIKRLLARLDALVPAVPDEETGG